MKSDLLIASLFVLVATLGSSSHAQERSPEPDPALRIAASRKLLVEITGEKSAAFNGDKLEDLNLKLLHERVGVTGDSVERNALLHALCVASLSRGSISSYESYFQILRDSFAFDIPSAQIEHIDIVTRRPLGVPAAESVALYASQVLYGLLRKQSSPTDIEQLKRALGRLTRVSKLCAILNASAAASVSLSTDAASPLPDAGASNPRKAARIHEAKGWHSAVVLDDWASAAREFALSGTKRLTDLNERVEQLPKEPRARADALMAIAEKQQGLSRSYFVENAIRSLDDWIKTTKFEDIDRRIFTQREAMMLELAKSERRPSASALLPQLWLLRRTYSDLQRLTNECRASILDAQIWLSHAQKEDGSFFVVSVDSGKPSSDAATRRPTGDEVGLTSLALIAWMSTGNGPHSGRFAVEIQKGLNFLLRESRNRLLDNEPVVLIGSEGNPRFLDQHSMATLALIEAFALTGEQRYKLAATAALKIILRSRIRTPEYEGAWGHGIALGLSNTITTGIITETLCSAQRSGILPRSDLVQPLERSVEFLHQMRDSESGRIGYYRQGSPSSRYEGLYEKFPPSETEACTASGTFSLLIAGDQSSLIELVTMSRALMFRRLPRYEPYDGRVDLYFWERGSLVAEFYAAKERKVWREAIEKALLPSQIKNDAGAGAGSWHPEDPWSNLGRAYSTSMAILALAAPQRQSLTWLQ